MKSIPKMALWVLSLFAILLVPKNAQAQQDIDIDVTSIDRTLEPGQTTSVNITITNNGDAPLNWDASIADIYGRGVGITFVKEDMANWILPANQDRISDNVWIARANNMSIFNAKSETSSDDNSPADTEWTLGSLNDASGFDTFRDSHGNDPGGLVGEVISLHTITDDEYFEIEFTSWTGGGTGGGFGYVRYPMSEYLYFSSANIGVLSPAASATLTLEIDAEDLASGMNAGTITIVSDDPDEGSIDIPISLEVLGNATFELSANTFSQTLTNDDDPIVETLTITNDGESALNWNTNGTNQRPFDMSGVTLSSYSGNVAAGETADLDVTFSIDRGATDGSYEWPITFYSNDPNNEEELVTISLVIIGDALLDYSSPEFDDTFVGSTSSGILELYNEGNATLEVSSIASSASQFVPASTSLSIEPGESGEVTILFSPDAAGTITSDLTIVSNDVDVPSLMLSISGEALDAPEISVTPLAFTESLDQESSMAKSITITNDGLSSLVWSYVIDQDLFKNYSTTVSFEKIDDADPSLESNQDRVSDDVWITRDSEGGLYDYNGVSEIKWAFGETSSLSVEDYTTSFRSAANDFAFGLPGKTMSLYLVDEGRFFDLEFVSWTCCSSGGGFSYIRTEYTGPIRPNAVEVVEIAAGESFQFDFDLVGEGVVEGSYENSINFLSNDPLQPEIVVSVNVSVTGTPDISATETESSLDTELGSTATMIVPIVNLGTSELQVSNVTIDNAVYAVQSTAFNVPALSTYYLEVEFTPAAITSYMADMTVTSNDPSNGSYVIALSGDGTAAPDIVFSSTMLSETLESGESTSEQSFTITNDGAGDLTWSLQGVFFEKEDYADPTLAENQDRIFEDVWITRGNDAPLYNAFNGAYYSETLFWGDGATGTLSFENGDYYQGLEDIGGLSSLPGNTLSLYAVEYDQYFDLMFESWTSGEGSGGEPGGGFSYTRVDAVPWLELNTTGATLGTEGTSVVGVTFNAADLNVGMYTFEYVVVSNDPTSPATTVTFSLAVTGSPELSIDEGSEFGFGDQFVDSEGAGSLVIRNNGAETLEISDIQFDDAAFSVSSTMASVEPDETVSIDLTFTPGAIQSYSATGTITSNDPAMTTTFMVSGTGIERPDLSIDVTTIEAELLSGGVKEESFTITNNGANPVNWEITKIVIPGLEAVLFEKPDYSDWTLEENQDRITDDVWLTRANSQGLFNIARETEYTSGRRLRIAIEVPLPESEADYASPKGTLWANSGTFEAFDDAEYSSWGNVIGGNARELPGTVKSMWIPDENRYFDLEFLSWSSGAGNERGGPGGFSYIRTETATWLNNFSDTNNTIVPEGDATVSFNIDAEGIAAGEYNAIILVSDGLNELEVDVTLTVLGLPEVSVSSEELDFENVFVGDESTLELEVYNSGLASLEISSIVSDNNAFEVTSAPASVGIEQSATIEVTFTPGEAINYIGKLTLNSNDGVNPALTIDLAGSGQTPPELNVNVTSLDETLFFGASSSQTFTISNTGDADLEWELGVNGETVAFSKADFADWTLEENQDRITDDVWITRGNSRGIFNIAQEAEYERDEGSDSPLGTLWAYGPTGDTRGREGPCCFEELRAFVEVSEDYGRWSDVVGGNPGSDDIFSMYLSESELYFDVVFTSWTSGNGEGTTGGGGFSYTRTLAFAEYNAVSFSATEGVVAPGESQQVTVFFNPTGSYDGRFELPLQVESNDPSGPVAIPLTLNVNGIIVENPVDDQLVNEGFGSSVIDISNVFADAQNDPLTYSVESSQEGIASVMESGGMLTVTEVGTGTTVISITAEDGKGSSDTFEFDFRVNTLPVINNGLADQSFENSFGTSIINISGVFGDADENDVLTVEVSTSADGVIDASLSGDLLTLTEVGPGTVDVTLTANDGFGGEVDDVFEVFVNKINQTITFGALSAVAEDVGSIQLTATASSGLAVTYESSNTSVATVSGSTLNILADGQTTITASQAGDDAYNPATSVSQSLTVDAVLGLGNIETVEIYPNPVEDYLSVANEAASKIEIYHLDGKLVLSQEISEKANLTDLDEGVYLIKVLDKNNTELFKGRLVKN